MKINVLFSFLIGFVFFKTSTMQAQTKQGIVLYEESRVLLTPEKRKQIEEQMPDPAIREMVFKRLEGNSKSDMALAFNDVMSCYQAQNVEEKDNDPRVKSMGSTVGKTFFKNLRSSMYTSQENVMGKPFVVEDTLKKINWKLTGDSKQFGKLNCQKAIATIGKYEVEAWFAMEIPVSSGPANYWGLPGLIIELKEKNGRTFTFKEFINEKPNESQMSLPKEGKKVSQKEYDNILAQKTKELTGGSGTGSGGVKILKMN